MSGQGRRGGHGGRAKRAWLTVRDARGEAMEEEESLQQSCLRQHAIDKRIDDFLVRGGGQGRCMNLWNWEESSFRSRLRRRWLRCSIRYTYTAPQSRHEQPGASSARDPPPSDVRNVEGVSADGKESPAASTSMLSRTFTPRKTISERIWGAYLDAPRPKPCKKEVDEAFAFLKKVETPLLKKGCMTAVDCCSGHGLFGLLPQVAQVKFAEGDIAETLPALLDSQAPSHEARQGVRVFAIHACNYLTDVIMDACVERSVSFAVMPCCHADRFNGRVRHAASLLEVPLAHFVDIARIGSLHVSLRMVPATVTPENRVIIANPREGEGGDRGRFDAREHEALKEVLALPALVSPSQRLSALASFTESNLHACLTQSV
ncbi:hypothetical protein GUITHDRAFT_111111 [Guillardia theta CCMP2712]|uniref:Methyltransferase domain-containing protein n=1 Tax=Guillardia theta (strain CCMP2712) TaxID=905079 RepID=L1J361_GUITC|nr:hypothetical protein GUITHDRAFT_111111 [Guillardia theta CCMP2712]EKX42742.1 hypothetical protein GUITHDRAFT_111111 [Guillardia theta CCMP2712]|eukprot:XP_005829722.1 hypothetical protein GUITHDRAFT_111111 [Guillardia theta CCMP2712]